MGFIIRKFAAYFLLVVIPFAAQSATVQLAEVTAETGLTVPVPIVVTDFTGVAVFEFYITHSTSVVEFAAVSGLTPSAVVNDVNGQTTISWFSTSPLTLQDGDTLLTLTYDVVGAAGEMSSLQFIGETYLADQTSHVIPSEFFDGSISVYGPQPPGSFQLLSPEDATPLHSLTASLVWQSTTDPNPDNSPLYDVWLDTSETLATRWLAGDGLSDTTLVVEELLDDETYYWTVHASDVNTAGTWASDTLSFSTDFYEPPAVFSLLSPANSDTVWNTDTTLVWRRTSDPDPYDSPHYDVWLDTLANLSTATLVADSTADTSLALTGLSDDQTWYWTVRATDSNTAGTTAAEVRSFKTYQPEAPSAFAYLSPVDGGEVNEYEVTVSWEAAEDPDPGDGVRYRVEWSEDPDFNTSFSGLTENTFFTIANLADQTAGHPSFAGIRRGADQGGSNGLDELSDNTILYWRVVAVDNFNLETAGGEGSAWSFTVRLPDAPTPFSLLHPADGDTVWGLDTTLVWQASNDPDPGETPFYDVLLDSLPDLSTAQLIAENVADTTFTLQNLLDDHTWYWTVRATDPGSAGTWARDTLSFRSYQPEAPLPFAYASPPDLDTAHEYEVEVFWHPAVDLDPDDLIQYTVEWSLDPEFDILFSGTTVDTSFIITDLADLLLGDGSDHGRSERDRTGQNSGTMGLDDLPDDNTIFWRVRAVDRFGLESAGQGGTAWSFHVDVFQLPAPFSLLSPVADDTIESLSATLTWHSTTDPDPYDIPHYDVWLDTVATFPAAWQIGDSLADTTLTVTGLLDDHTYYWTVRATDSNSPGQWADDTLFFHTYVPEAPSPFHLLTPEDDTFLTFEPPMEVLFSWTASVDPDPEDEVLYTFWCTLSSTGFEETTLSYADLSDTAYTINLPDSLNLQDWPDTLNILWHVEAIAGGDTVQSEETWHLSFAPTLDVDEQYSSLPREFGITAAYPNPFNPTMTVEIGLPHTAELRVELFDILGRRVSMLHHGRTRAGYQQLTLNGSQLASGMYFLRASVPGKLNQVKKVTLMK